MEEGKNEEKNPQKLIKRKVDKTKDQFFEKKHKIDQAPIRPQKNK